MKVSLFQESSLARVYRMGEDASSVRSQKPEHFTAQGCRGFCGEDSFGPICRHLVSQRSRCSRSPICTSFRFAPGPFLLVMSAAAADSTSIWDPCACIDMRPQFSKAEGAVQQELVFEVYGEDPVPVLVPYFGANGDRLLSRDPVNSRCQLAVRRKYMRGILKHGVRRGP